MNPMDNELQCKRCGKPILTNLRRQATDALTDTYRATHAFHRRPLTKQASPKLPAGYELSRHDNIANRLADRKSVV